MDIPLLVSASGILLAMAVGFAFGLRAFAKQIGQRFILDWALSWGALAVYATAASLALLAVNAESLRTTRALWSLLSLAAAWAHLVYLGRGLTGIVSPDVRPLKYRAEILATLFGAAGVLVLVSSGSPETRLALYIVRVVLVGLGWSIAYLDAARLVRRGYLVRVSVAAKVLLIALIAYGTLRFLEPLAHLVGPNPVLAQLLTFGGLPMLAALGAGMISALLELERDVRVAAVAAESAERQRLQATLARREDWFRAMIENANDIIMQVQRDGRIDYVSPASKHILGLDPAELVGGNAFDLLHPDDVPVVSDAAERAFVRDPSVPRTVPFRVRNAAGEFIPAEATSHPYTEADGELRLVVAIRDVRERQRLETELVSARRLESVGRLAGGVAHDFNNLLTAIVGNTALMRELTAGNADLQSGIAEIEQSARRGAELTRRLLAFARRQMVEPRVVDVAAEIREMERLLLRLLGETKMLRLELPPGLASIRIDPTALEQILVNLAVNARDAMSDGGVLTIRARNESIGDAGKQGSSIPAGVWLRIDVVDTGVGIDPSIRPHLFEPFFTTKADSGGTGLGLPTVYGAVMQAGGRLKVESAPGHGATFSLFFPALTESARVITPTSTAAPEAAKPGETVLLIEDEATVRDVTTKLLQRLGFAVLTAVDGQDGIEVAAAYRGALHLIVSDLMMPRLNGHEAVTRIRAARPNTPVVFISGYSEEALRWRDGTPKPGKLLAKPFTLHELARAAREAIDG